jgi:lipopolysaccharide export system permease protein
MGAIIRKGGFGYPILVSIIFFVIFVFLAILCRKLAESYLMTPFWAAMTPCGILALFGIYVTRKAMNDSQLFSTDGLERFLFRLRLARKQKKALDAQ